MLQHTLMHALSAGLFALLITGAPALATDIRVNQTNHPLDAYAVDVLRIALKHMPTAYALKIGTSDITQTRAIENLESGQMDVMWLASNQTVENRLLPVRFPLLKGLLGHRVFIINADNQPRFSQIRNFNDLSQLKFGQGFGWPDVDILRHNGLRVVTTSKYQNLFPMTDGNRFDAFPRGVLEPWVELATHPSLHLAVEQQIVLIYTLPFYFFVTRDNEQLAEEIHTALDAALADGSFDQFFFNAGMVKEALARADLRNRKAFRITNPTLSPQTPLERREYWLTLGDL